MVFVQSRPCVVSVEPYADQYGAVIGAHSSAERARRSFGRALPQDISVFQQTTQVLHGMVPPEAVPRVF